MVCSKERPRVVNLVEVIEDEKDSGHPALKRSTTQAIEKSSRKKNRDLKPLLEMMVGNNPTLWIEKLPVIRLALNTANCESTDHTVAYLTLARELRTLDQVNNDLRSVIHNDNFVPEFTPYLKRFEAYMSQIKENIEMSLRRCREEKLTIDYIPG
ncbi:uncharacterized protein TNCV_187551 [Trichonephila clavipes]|nr:uncharacterized protein TNCV_187551 [Trichonephila clavipes]